LKGQQAEEEKRAGRKERRKERRKEGRKGVKGTMPERRKERGSYKEGWKEGIRRKVEGRREEGGWKGRRLIKKNLQSPVTQSLLVVEARADVISANSTTARLQECTMVCCRNQSGCMDG
jgi:hypothetical protein